MVGVLQLDDFCCGDEGHFTVTGYAPGQQVWLWAGPQGFVDPGMYCDAETYDYQLIISGLAAPVMGEPTAWSTVKALYE